MEKLETWCARQELPVDPQRGQDQQATYGYRVVVGDEKMSLNERSLDDIWNAMLFQYDVEEQADGRPSLGPLSGFGRIGASVRLWMLRRIFASS